LLGRTLAALSTQTVEHELLICDSDSTDGSVELARAHQARVVEIPPSQFNHGASRNLLMREASGGHVALLSQDAEPADRRWLEHLLAGFALAADVGVVYGPYQSRPGAPKPVRLELERWFTSLSPDHDARVDRLQPSESSLPAIEFVGRRGFLTDANACISREAWRMVPFRPVPYAEDRVLAVDMLRAGYSKVFVPQAAVLHSHAYSALDELRRSFDEWRGLREVYGWRESAQPGQLLRHVRGELAHARSELALAQASPAESVRTLGAVGAHQIPRLAGAILGSRVDMLRPQARRWLSLERRASFCPLDLDREASTIPARDLAS
jgi:rhamnosyltransferase